MDKDLNLSIIPTGNYQELMPSQLDARRRQTKTRNVSSGKGTKAMLDRINTSIGIQERYTRRYHEKSEKREVELNRKS